MNLILQFLLTLAMLLAITCELIMLYQNIVGVLESKRTKERIAELLDEFEETLETILYEE